MLYKTSVLSKNIFYVVQRTQLSMVITDKLQMWYR